MNKLLKQYTDLKWERKVLVSAGALALIPALVFALWRSPEAPPAASDPVEVDTFIPKGFVLVPIEVVNYEALDSVLGRFALVDLFQGGTSEMPKQKLVARNVRLMRAPQNPSHFAVLVPEEQTGQILQSGALFTVIVKRRAKAGTEIVKEATVTHRTIVYEGGSK